MIPPDILEILSRSLADVFDSFGITDSEYDAALNWLRSQQEAS